MVVKRRPPAGHSIAQRAEVFAALGDSRRLEIAEELASSDRTPGELIEKLELSSALLAHHLDVLEDAGSWSASNRPAIVASDSCAWWNSIGIWSRRRLSHIVSCSSAGRTRHDHSWPQQCGGNSWVRLPRVPVRRRLARFTR